MAATSLTHALTVGRKVTVKSYGEGTISAIERPRVGRATYWVKQEATATRKARVLHCDPSELTPLYCGALNCRACR